MPRSDLPLPPATFFILFALATGEKHGYAIMQEARKLSDNRFQMGPATLYTSCPAPAGFALDRRSPRAGGRRPPPPLLPLNQTGEIGAASGNGTDGSAGAKVESHAVANKGVRNHDQFCLIGAACHDIGASSLLYPERSAPRLRGGMAPGVRRRLESARREAGIRGVFRVWRCALAEVLRFALPGPYCEPGGPGTGSVR